MSSHVPGPLFGYGSLMLPMSLLGRFENLNPPLNAVFDDDTDVEDVYDIRSIDEPNPLASEDVTETYLRSDAVEKWEQYRDRIQYYPARISGFRRYYSYDQIQDGSMLEAIRTSDSSDWINGMIITGLTPEQHWAVEASETEMEREEIDESDITLYEEVPEPDLSGCRIFFSDKTKDFISCSSRPNPIYHQRILTGIVLLGRRYGANLAKQFYQDFRRTTFESDQIMSECENPS